MSNTDATATIDLIYRVSDLKAAFNLIKKDGVKTMMNDPVPALENPQAPQKRKSCLEDCPSMDKAIAATKALELFARMATLDDKFNDNAFIRLSGRLSELPTSVGQPSKPFPTYFRDGAYTLVSEHVATKTEAGAEAMVAGRLSLEF